MKDENVYCSIDHQVFLFSIYGSIVPLICRYVNDYYITHTHSHSHISCRSYDFRFKFPFFYLFYSSVVSSFRGVKNVVLPLLLAVVVVLPDDLSTGWKTG